MNTKQIANMHGNYKLQLSLLGIRSITATAIDYKGCKALYTKKSQVPMLTVSIELPSSRSQGSYAPS